MGRRHSQESPNNKKGMTTDRNCTQFYSINTYSVSSMKTVEKTYILKVSVLASKMGFDLYTHLTYT